MVATLTIARIDLEWADNQYWSTLYQVVEEINKIMQPKEKETKKVKVSASQMQNFIV